jgi:hypothetical protein
MDRGAAPSVALARFVPLFPGMNALLRPLAAAIVGALIAGAVGYGIALAALRSAGPTFVILLCAPLFALRGWRLGGEIAGGDRRFGASAARVVGLLTGGMMGLFLGGWAQLVQFRSPYPVAAAPLALLFAVRGFWWGFETLRRRELWRF